MTREQVKAVLERVLTRPLERQEELAEITLEIEADLEGGAYRASPEELEALDAAERSGLASPEEVDAAFKSFRRAQRLSTQSRRLPISARLPPTVSHLAMASAPR